MSPAPPSLVRRPWYREIPRKIMRGLVITLPFVFFGAAVALFYAVPYLVDRGTFDELLRSRLSEALHSDVSFRHVQIQKVNELVVQDLSIQTADPVLKKLSILEVRVRFSLPVPLGEVERVEIAGMQGDINIDSEFINKLAEAEPEKKKQKKKWQERFEIDLVLPPVLKIPPVVVRDSVLQGVIGIEKYRIEKLNGSILPEESDIPFKFSGSSGGQDNFFVLEGKVRRVQGPDGKDKEAHLEIKSFKLGDMGITVFLDTKKENASSKLTFDLRAASVTRELAQLIQIVTGGTQVAGNFNGRSTIMTTNGKLEQFEFQGEAKGYTVKSGATSSESEQPTTIQLIAKVSPSRDSLELNLTVTNMRLRLKDGSLITGERFTLNGTVDDIDGDFHWAVGTFSVEKVRVEAGPLRLSEFSRCDVNFDVKRLEQSEIYESEIDITLKDLFIDRMVDRREGTEIKTRELIHDFSDGLVRINLHTREEPARQLYQLTRSTIYIPRVGVLQASGMLQNPMAGPVYQLTFNGDRLELSGLLHRLQDERLIDDKMEGDGEASGTLVMRGGSWGSDVKVDAQLKKVDFRFAAWKIKNLDTHFLLSTRSERAAGSEFLTIQLDPFSAEELELGNLKFVNPHGVFPLVVAQGPPGDLPVPRGWIECDDLRLEQLTTGKQRFTLIAQDNGLRLVEGLNLTGLGGTLKIGPIRVRDMLASNFELKTSLRAENLELDQLFKLFGIQNGPKGTSYFFIDDVTYTREKLEAKGDISVQALGGNLYVRNLKIENPFDKLADYSCDFDFQHLSLQQAWTKMLGEGVLRGTVRGAGHVRIFHNGDPEEFWIHMEIDKDYPDREEQYLDVTALKKVVVALQNDEKAGEGFDKMPYKKVTYGKLGMYITLNTRQILRFRGQYYRQGEGKPMNEYSFEDLQNGRPVTGAQEYLVVGAPPTPLNIINQTPENGLEWEQFIGRLKKNK